MSSSIRRTKYLNEQGPYYSLPDTTISLFLLFPFLSLQIAHFKHSPVQTVGSANSHSMCFLSEYSVRMVIVECKRLKVNRYFPRHFPFMSLCLWPNISPEHFGEETICLSTGDTESENLSHVPFMPVSLGVTNSPWLSPQRTNHISSIFPPALIIRRLDGGILLGSGWKSEQAYLTLDT